MEVFKKIRVLATTIAGAALVGAFACGPIDVDAPIDADSDIDNRRNTTVNINEIRTIKIVELEDEQKTAVCQAVTEETSVSCRRGNGQTFEYTYSRSSCGDDLDAVAGSCEATVDDYLTCEAIDACTRHRSARCERLLNCGESLKIFVDIDVRNDIEVNVDDGTGTGNE